MKRYLPDASQMKEIDRYSIEEKKIPSLILMERAALAVCEVIGEEFDKNVRLLFVCSRGNNGADGLCSARILKLRGWQPEILLVGDAAKSTPEFDVQYSICKKIGVTEVTTAQMNEYDGIVDAIFGIGLTRNVEGEYADIIEKINGSGRKIIAVDIPSGINPSSGKVCKTAVRADHTVTFGFEKRGIVLFPGAAYAGVVHVMRDVGFAEDQVDTLRCAWTLEKEGYHKLLPVRRQDSNKGSYGRVLAAAGSQNMAGAAYFAAYAAYRTGSGLVKLLTDRVNRDVLMTLVPEAVMEFYNDMDKAALEKEFEWADTIIAGPGLSQSILAQKVVMTLLENTENRTHKNIILDADALNLIAGCGRQELLEHTIITPHPGEMARLLGDSVAQVKENLVETAVDFAQKYRCICVLKDARTVVTDGTEIYINTTGNHGMATGGSGDVLTGIIAGLAAQGADLYTAAYLGTFLHGMSGDRAAQKHGCYGMTARDILSEISPVMQA
jgi:NAD(P)H-hydrate epimerase